MNRIPSWRRAWLQGWLLWLASAAVLSTIPGQLSALALMAQRTEEQKAAEPTPQFGLDQPPAARPSVAAPQPAAIEQTLADLLGPADQERISWLIEAISAQPDTQVRQQLFAQLDERMASFFEPPGHWFAVLREIDSLHLGSNATVEDFRRRDAVVAKIAQIRDPTIRYRLRDILDEDEQEQAAAEAESARP